MLAAQVNPGRLWWNPFIYISLFKPLVALLLQESLETPEVSRLVMKLLAFMIHLGHWKIPIWSKLIQVIIWLESNIWKGPPVAWGSKPSGSSPRAGVTCCSFDLSNLIPQAWLGLGGNKVRSFLEGQCHGRRQYSMVEGLLRLLSLIQLTSSAFPSQPIYYH